MDTCVCCTESCLVHARSPYHLFSPAVQMGMCVWWLCAVTRVSSEVAAYGEWIVRTIRLAEKRQHAGGLLQGLSYSVLLQMRGSTELHAHCTVNTVWGAERLRSRSAVCVLILLLGDFPTAGHVCYQCVTVKYVYIYVYVQGIWAYTTKLPASTGLYNCTWCLQLPSLCVEQSRHC